VGPGELASEPDYRRRHEAVVTLSSICKHFTLALRRVSVPGDEEKISKQCLGECLGLDGQARSPLRSAR